jgi:hypothetical protein
VRAEVQKPGGVCGEGESRVRGAAGVTR